MTTDPVALALKIAKYIVEGRGCSYTEIAERAKSHGIDERTLQAAMTLVHKNRRIKTTNAGGDIQYLYQESVAAKPIESPFAPFADYPVMDETNDAHHEIFSGLDYSYLFLKPEEMLKYKAQMQGKAYVPRRRYERS